MGFAPWGLGVAWGLGDPRLGLSVRAFGLSGSAPGRVFLGMSPSGYVLLSYPFWHYRQNEVGADSKLIF